MIRAKPYRRSVQLPSICCEMLHVYYWKIGIVSKFCTIVSKLAKIIP